MLLTCAPSVAVTALRTAGVSSTTSTTAAAAAAPRIKTTQQRSVCVFSALRWIFACLHPLDLAVRSSRSAGTLRSHAASTARGLAKGRSALLTVLHRAQPCSSQGQVRSFARCVRPGKSSLHMSGQPSLEGVGYLAGPERQWGPLARMLQKRSSV